MWILWIVIGIIAALIIYVAHLVHEMRDIDFALEDDDYEWFR